MTSHQQAVVLRTLELYSLGEKTTSGCSFSDDGTDSTVPKIAARGVFVVQEKFHS